MERHLLIDGIAGIYVPRNFYLGFYFKQWGLKKEEFEALSSPDNEEYWEAWEDLLAAAYHIDDEGHGWYLVMDDGDLFAEKDIIRE